MYLAVLGQQDFYKYHNKLLSFFRIVLLIYLISEQAKIVIIRQQNKLESIK